MASVELTSKRSLTQLNHEIEEAEAEAARLEKERAAAAKESRRAARRWRYYRLAQALRKPTASLELWRMGVMLFGPLLVGIVALIAVHFPTGSYPLAFFAFLVGTVVGVGLFASLMYHPADTLLPAAITEAEAQSRLANARLEEKLGRIAEVKQRLQRLIDERRDQITSGKLQRAALLQRNWKSMPNAEWEDFIVEVLRTHGAKVERTGRIGGEDANLVADLGPRRVALVTEGEGQIVESSAVRRALESKDRHRCDACAVVINRRFKGGVQEYAQRSGCAAIGASEFPDFVMGKIEL